MAWYREGFRVVTQGQALKLTAVTLLGTSKTVYSDQAGASPVTLPYSFSSDTTFYVADAGAYSVTITQADGSVLNPPAAMCRDGVITSIDPTPTTAQLLADVTGQPTTYARLADVNVGAASGDASGATDTATLQAALTAARIAGGGRVAGRPGQTYQINSTLVIGTGTELDMTGCTVKLVSGSNCLMLANYSSLNPITTTGKLAVSSGATLFTLENTSDPAYVATQADPGKGAGWTFDVPATIGGVSVKFVGTLNANGVNAGTRQFTLTGSQTFPGTTIGTYTAFRLYSRDTRIIVRGGIWDRQDNGTGDTETNHVMRWRGVDGVTVRDVTYLSSGSNGRYAMLVQNASSVRVDGVAYGANPSQGLWSVTAGYARDGVHITGPTKNVIVRNVFGYPGDDMVAITAADFSGIAGDYWGHVTDITIEDVRPTAAGQAAVKVMGGPSADVKRILVRNVYGSAGGSAGIVTIGDDNRQASTSNGVFDDITVENVGGDPGAGKPLVSIMAATAIGRITLRNLAWNRASDTAAGIVAIGTNLYAAGAVATTIASLVVEGMSISGINAATKAVYVETGSTVTSLSARAWRSGYTTLKLIGGPGTITFLRLAETSTDPASRIARVGNYYPPTIIPSNADVFAVLTQDKLYVSLPRVAQEPITVDQLVCNTNIVGSAGSVARLGIYIVNGEDPYAVTLSSAYATLLVDAGTVATDVGTGSKTVTIGSPVTIGPGQAFALAIAHQVAAPASIRMRNAVNSQPTPWGGSSPHTNVPQVLTATGVTGALPGTFTPTAFDSMTNGSDNGVWFRRSA